MFYEAVTRRVRPPPGGPCFVELVWPSETVMALLAEGKSLLTDGRLGSSLHL